PGVSGEDAADGARLLRGRVRGIEVVGRDGLGHAQVEHARLHHDPGVGDVDVQDAIHPRQTDHDAVRDRQGTAGEPRARAARDEGNARLVADADDGLNLLRRGGQHDGGRDHAKIREAVALIGAQLLRLGEQPVAGHDGPKPVQDAGVHHFTIVNPCGTAAGKTYAYINTINPTIAPSAIECQNTYRKIIPSLPTWFVADVATVIDCASTILPITPPAELAAHISTESSLSWSAVIRCRLPNSALDEVSLPVSATPSHPRYVPKNGYSHPVRVNARPSTASSPE